MGGKEAKTKPKGGSKCFKLSIVFLLLTIVPVTGFSLRSCRISNDVALCVNSGLGVVPKDVPSTVKGFDLSLNRISKIQVSDFKTFSILTQLDLNNNRISKIDTGAFVDLISLQKLNLNNNKLRELRDYLFLGLSNLQELRLNSNQITAVSSTSFRSLTSLTLLDISKNKLAHVTKLHTILQHLPNLRELKIQNNHLTKFRSWELTNSSLALASIDLSQNPVENFQITADVFPNLTWINLARTPKKLIWDVRNKTFLRRVSTLDISWFEMPFDNIKKILESVNSSLTILRMDEIKYRYNHEALINVSCTIPTLSKLQLRRNKFNSVSSDLFQLCINITELDLKDNLIQNISNEAFRSFQRLRIVDLSRNMLPSVPLALRNLRTLSELDLSRNKISTLECHDFANLTRLRQLSLHLNTISVLKDCVFKDLTRLDVLKLQSNTISKLNGAFKTYLPNLRQLRLNGNQLTILKYGEFRGLKSLQNLSLHQNQIKKIENGSFIGLTSLTDIQLLTNELTQHDLNKGGFNDLINLRRLDLSDNHINYKSSSALPYPPFSKLSHLQSLSLPGQKHRGKAQLPCNFLQGLTNLTDFKGRNMQLLSFPKDMFKYTPQLQTLDLSSNELIDISPDLFSPIQGLKSLYISRTNLRSLDFLIDANLTELEFLQSRKNAYSVISKDVIGSLPALIYVDLQGNSFTCDCDNAWFLKWVEKDNRTQVFDAYNFECNYPPDLKGKKLLDLDVGSCTVDIDFICYVSTTCMILLFMGVSFTYNFLRWQLVYAYYLFLAFLFDSKQRNKQAPTQYDAFVSYNVHDEPWVIGQMLPKLEGEQGWKLCLHHRDFEPGKPIIENITDAIYGSRKTICVISRKYLESEWCSREIQVASFRLFDEHKDVLILVFLEDIPRSQLSPYYSMRKLLQRRTYLSWLQAQEHTELFWEKLRQALKTRRDLSQDRLLLTVEDRP